MHRGCWKTLSVVAVLIAWGAASYAQSRPTPHLPGQCDASPRAPLAELEQLKETLEREVARKTAEAAGQAKGQEKDLRKIQEQLLDVIFQIDCQRNSEPSIRSVEPGARGAAAPSAVPAAAIEVTTYFATNRKRTAASETVKFYGSDFQPTYEYGRALVTIPRTHVPGNLEMPSLWKMELDSDANKHFVLKAVIPLGADSARTEMAKRLAGMSSRSLLLFVHGYDTTFAEAALRTAQLAHDLEFPGLAFFYSWPSAGSALRYWRDEEASQLSEAVFEQLLGELSQFPATNIYIVAHSMGNRIVAGALRSRVIKKEETKHIREVLLAAPDINAELFRTAIAPQLAAMQGTRTTIYASSSDLALRASKVVHGFRRVGETLGGVLVYPGVDTIDASGAATMIREYGHSYLMDSSSVLKDVRTIIQQKLAAKQRGLTEMGKTPDLYWQLR
jgi:esterase/lipase superfamily enzyme